MNGLLEYSSVSVPDIMREAEEMWMDALLDASDPSRRDDEVALLALIANVAGLGCPGAFD